VWRKLSRLQSADFLVRVRLLRGRLGRAADLKSAGPAYPAENEKSRRVSQGQDSALPAIKGRESGRLLDHSFVQPSAIPMLAARSTQSILHGDLLAVSNL